jgi:arginyl-tRNA synthetase
MINYKNHIAHQLNIDGVSLAELEDAIVLTQDATKGDYSLPCFKLAKTLRLSPVAIAEKLAATLLPDRYIERAEAVNGYLNIFINKSTAVFDSAVEVFRAADAYGSSNIRVGKTICIDYSSVNIAKSMHIGHLGTTAIGSSLYKMFRALGYNVVGINHLGDYGTQFGKMIVAYLKWGDDEKIRQGGAKALQEIYVRYHQEAENDPSLDIEARQWFARIEKGDAEATKYFQLFKDITLNDVKRIYDRLNVTFDSWDGESFYNDKMDAPLRFLEEKGLVTISDGAKVVDLTPYDMPPCLLVKSDGSSLYATRDIAAAFYRKQTYDFSKCLYVVAYQQNLHFKQVFKVLELAGLPWASDLVHVAYGMVSLEDGAMSTRKGNTVFLEDVLNSAASKALSIIESKNPNLTGKEAIAEAVGCGAVVFSAVENARIKDITFTFDRVLNFDGETSPYIQYTHARCCSLLEKAGGMGGIDVEKVDTSVYDNDESLALAKLLARFPDVIKDAAFKYEPSILSKFLIDLCQAFNRYYLAEKVISDNLAQQNARLLLVNATKVVVKKGLALLGIAAPEKM